MINTIQQQGTIYPSLPLQKQQALTISEYQGKSVLNSRPTEQLSEFLKKVTHELHVGEQQLLNQITQMQKLQLIEMLLKQCLCDATLFSTHTYQANGINSTSTQVGQLLQARV